MKPNAVIEHFGNGAAAARAIGVTRAAVSVWRKRGAIPLSAQIKFEVASKGRLRAELPKLLRRQSQHP